MTKRIDRYLFGLILVPLIGTLVVAAMLLVLDRMLRLFDFVINEGGPVNVVWRMLGNLPSRPAHIINMNERSCGHATTMQLEHTACEQKKDGSGNNAVKRLPRPIDVGGSGCDRR